MNFYQRHIGDYLKDTSHLSLLEHGIYTRLLDVYYTRESGIPDDQAARLIGARGGEIKALKAVLNEYFKLVDGIWIQSRCEIEIQSYRDKSDKAKRSASARWEKERTHTERNANASADAMRTHSEGNAPINQYPITSNQNIKPAYAGSDRQAGSPPCPHEEIIALYHETLPNLTRVKVWNETRKSHLKQRWREFPTLDEWRELFRRIGKSKFLTGQLPGRNGGKPFLASLDWIVMPQNFAKILEGKYD